MIEHVVVLACLSKQHGSEGQSDDEDFGDAEGEESVEIGDADDQSSGTDQVSSDVSITRKEG